jgi:sugar phosphate isomerase/epimerase
MKLAIVVSTHTTSFSDVAFAGDFDTNVAQVAEMGYDGVELAVRDPKLVDGHEMLSLLEEHGLEIPILGTGQAWVEERLSLVSPDSKTRAAAIQRVMDHIELAQTLSTMVMLGLIRGPVEEPFTSTRAMSLLVDALRTCAAEAASKGVRLAIEPINRYEADMIHSAHEGLELLEQVGHQNVGLILDTYHMNIEEPSLEGSIQATGDRLFHFHVSDSNRLHPGAGHIDFESIIRALDDTGYRGALSGEFLPNPDPVTAARRCFEHIRPLLDKAGVRHG